MHPLCAAAHLLAVSALMQAPDLTFAPGVEGQFTFNTGVVKGRLTAGREQQGLTSLVDVKSGRELSKGHTDYGVFSYYRFLSTDQRYADSGWKLPKSAVRTGAGAVRVVWPAQADHPFELTAVYRWVRPDALEVETTVKPERDLPKFEVFVGSYFADSFRCKVYLKPGRHVKGEPELLAADVSPLTVGVYYAFPRDLAGAQILYDGRWLRGSNPVDWAVSRYLAGGLAVQEDPTSGLSCVLMSRPEDCFCVYASYNMTPPDGVAGHHSTYLGLFGRDLKAGQVARTTSRLVVGGKLSAEQVVAEYRKFIAP